MGPALTRYRFRQVWRVCAEGNPFLRNTAVLQDVFLKETSEACMKRQGGNPNKKKNLQFSIVLHITSSALQFCEIFVFIS